MLKRLRPYGSRFLKALQNASPVIAFFFAGFALVYGIFGMQYVSVVSVVTVFFQIRHKRNDNTPHQYARLLAVGSLLIVFAYLSSLNLWLCLLFNLCIPFVLVFAQSTQFNPKGYFSYAMIFVFLSLMPPEHLRELAIELLVFCICVGLMALSIRIYAQLFARPAAQTATLESGFTELSELLLLLACPEQQKQLEQRFSYLIGDSGWRGELDAGRIRLLREISVFLRELAPAAERPLVGRYSRREGIRWAQRMLDSMDIPEGRIKIFCRSLLHMMILILRRSSSYQEPVHTLDRRNFGELLRRIKARCTRESFEMRFAMRLSMVMTVSCGLSFLLPVTRSYWIPLNAFLLIQPSYEDSRYRMKTRPIGTLIGCCIQFLVYPLLPGLGGQIAFSLVMIALMYCAAPGTWNQPIFSTCYALTLTAMTLDQNIAITLRLLYLAAAVAIVFIVNSFFFPMRRETQFRYNFKALFRLNNSYWDIIRAGLTGETNLAVSNEILTYFHMIYQECSAYVKKNAFLPFRPEQQTVLVNLWHMFSELEQIHFLVQTKCIRPEENGRLVRMIEAIQEELYPIISYENFPQIRKELRYEEPEAAYVLNQYLDHAEKLLVYKHCIPF